MVTTTSPDASALYPTTRPAAVREAAGRAGLDALLLTPGPDLRYVTGYDAMPLERLTCLVVPVSGEPFLMVPRLELPAAEHSPASRLGVEFVAWDETDDPFAEVARRLGPVARVGLADRMWALQSLRFRAAMPGAEQTLAGDVLRELRMRKSPAEKAALAEAGAAIDAVHALVPGLLKAGRTEREVGRDIAEAIVEAGHARVDFVIVGSGPNGASPHAELTDRVIRPGEPVVVDIGGTMPSGYCSDSTRVYCVGEPPADFAAYYEVLRAAQEAACAHVRPGVTCESVDAAAREVIAEAGYGEYFVHRTGHGIGLETHEEPYIVAGNTEEMRPGFAFSVEPGIYLPGRHGARIEDIVVCGETAGERLNGTTRELVVV
ncbi:aminopeptidase P family protein [Microbispora triticiradicis]|uniref:Aminopeptidase P family protein n=3 Tax=Microbispora TaxID=2005 RepID=A0ABY3M1H5_9ACTN|nr:MULTISPECIES: Xaa-Pro peptidase family protein [Microbispora]RGA02616.1 aminopeptidase P family protein [Microbispora triticiradicis]TLP59928.1 aminopeptidase P family protein [Microbispora fusca]TYB63516.1 aminopeptidase P family protein [Microbispora tritici]